MANDPFFGEYFSRKRMKKWFLGESKARVKENLIWRELVLAKMAYKSKFAKITSLKVNE